MNVSMSIANLLIVCCHATNFNLKEIPKSDISRVSISNLLSVQMDNNPALNDLSVCCTINSFSKNSLGLSEKSKFCLLHSHFIVKISVNLFIETWENLT